MELKQVQFAEDWDPAKVKFPLGAQPKVDGVRGANLHGTMTARTMRPFTSQHVTRFFSQNGFRGFDGELAADIETHSRLCSLTTSATNTIEGEPWLMWHTFDFLTLDTVELAYQQRYDIMLRRIESLKADTPMLGAHLTPMPMVIVRDLTELECLLEEYAEKGYEGGILRGLDVNHKNGRSSPTHRGLLRCKTFLEVDARIDSVYEGFSNQNELETDRLGRAKRSTHAENMVPNGMVGGFNATLLEDAVHPLTKRVVHKKGHVAKFGAGRATHAERKLWWENPSLIEGKIMKGQIFPHGEKDKTRFPTFQSLRADSDYIPK